MKQTNLQGAYLNSLKFSSSSTCPSCSFLSSYTPSFCSGSIFKNSTILSVTQTRNTRSIPNSSLFPKLTQLIRLMQLEFLYYHSHLSLTIPIASILERFLDGWMVVIFYCLLTFYIYPIPPPQPFTLLHPIPGHSFSVALCFHLNYREFGLSLDFKDEAHDLANQHFHSHKCRDWFRDSHRTSASTNIVNLWTFPVNPGTIALFPTWF